jgi:hypothetical protein
VTVTGGPEFIPSTLNCTDPTVTAALVVLSVIVAVAVRESMPVTIGGKAMPIVVVVLEGMMIAVGVKRFVRVPSPSCPVWL